MEFDDYEVCLKNMKCHYFTKSQIVKWQPWKNKKKRTKSTATVQLRGEKTVFYSPWVKMRIACFTRYTVLCGMGRYTPIASHNPKVVGSNPAAATNVISALSSIRKCLFLCSFLCNCSNRAATRLFSLEISLRITECFLEFLKNIADFVNRG